MSQLHEISLHTAVRSDDLVSLCVQQPYIFCCSLYLLLSPDINECSTSNGGCEHSCSNSQGSFSCSCRSGFSLDNNGRTCSGELYAYASFSESLPVIAVVDFFNFYCLVIRVSDYTSKPLPPADNNECSSNNGGCSQTCINEDGGFRCSCLGGFQLGNDGRSCSGKSRMSQLHEISLHTAVQSVQSNISCLSVYSNRTLSAASHYISSSLQTSTSAVIVTADVSTSAPIRKAPSAAVANQGSLWTAMAKTAMVSSTDTPPPPPPPMRSAPFPSPMTTPPPPFPLPHEECPLPPPSLNLPSPFLPLDNNECNSNNGGCNQVCTNTAGSFRCSCNNGFQLGSDRLTCSGECGLAYCVYCKICGLFTKLSASIVRLLLVFYIHIYLWGV